MAGDRQILRLTAHDYLYGSKLAYPVSYRNRPSWFDQKAEGLRDVGRGQGEIVPKIQYPRDAQQGRLCCVVFRPSIRDAAAVQMSRYLRPARTHPFPLHDAAPAPPHSLLSSTYR
ncbi:unnamed protein product [Pieris macdunnoughi]|uniref:Uncharacterized protein n=1 Tax=Pieris macdunnoughi TaxID=345717 RepID=A0A821Y1L8_9NEOP|nr:unnamed protein product [Pieris macdunnoughi]